MSLVPISADDSLDARGTLALVTDFTDIRRMVTITRARGWGMRRNISHRSMVPEIRILWPMSLFLDHRSAPVMVRWMVN